MSPPAAPGPAAGPDPGALADLAAPLAIEAGRQALELAESARRSATTKSSATDLVTLADQAAEDLIVTGLLAARPDDGIEGEEGASRVGTSGVVWHIDPIDGTTNYVYDLPLFAVSIAAAVRGTMLSGTVYNPVSEELFEARLGAGATLDGEPITASDKDELASALIYTGFSYQPEIRRAQARVMAELLPEIRDIRRLGSAALDLCSVACGRADAYFEVGLNVWDFAAGALIAREAGALCTDLADGPPSSGFVLAAPPALHRTLGDRLRALGADVWPA